MDTILHFRGRPRIQPGRGVNTHAFSQRCSIQTVGQCLGRQIGIGSGCYERKRFFLVTRLIANDSQHRGLIYFLKVHGDDIIRRPSYPIGYGHRHVESSHIDLKRYIPEDTVGHRGIINGIYTKA